MFSALDGHFGSFQFGVITYDTAINIFTHISMDICIYFC